MAPAISTTAINTIKTIPAIFNFFTALSLSEDFSHKKELWPASLSLFLESAARLSNPAAVDNNNSVPVPELFVPEVYNYGKISSRV
jgi:hypothetical protein